MSPAANVLLTEALQVEVGGEAVVLLVAFSCHFDLMISLEQVSRARPLWES